MANTSAVFVSPSTRSTEVDGVCVCVGGWVGGGGGGGIGEIHT